MSSCSTRRRDGADVTLGDQLADQRQELAAVSYRIFERFEAADEEMVDADEKQEGGKRQKVEETADEAEARRRLKAEKRKDKREKKKEKAAKLKEKRDAKKAAKQDGDVDGAATEKSKVEKTSKKAPADDDDEDEDDAAARGDGESSYSSGHQFY